MYHEKESFSSSVQNISSFFIFGPCGSDVPRSSSVLIQHLFVLNVFVLHAMPSSCPMDEVHCLLVLNIFALLDCKCLWFSIRHRWVFAVCIPQNFTQNFTDHAPVFLHQVTQNCVFAPSTSVGTTLHYLTASLSSALTTPSITSSLLLGVCSS